MLQHKTQHKTLHKILHKTYLEHSNVHNETIHTIQDRSSHEDLDKEEIVTAQTSFRFRKVESVACFDVTCAHK